MQLLINALIAGSFLALIASGLALMYGVMGIFNLALGQMALIGGYATWWFHQSLGMPLWVSLFLGLVVGAAVAWLTYELVVAPFFRHHPFLPLVTTIALSMILDGAILLLFEEKPRSIIPGVKSTFDLLGARVSIEQIVLIAVTAVILVCCAWVLHSTSLGRRIRAVVQQEQAALSLGIPAPALQRLIFIASGVLAACGGIYIGIDANLSPVIGFSITIKAYAAVIAGGKGNIWGAVLAAYLLALLEQLIIGVPWTGSYLPAGYQQTVALLFIIVFLLFRPTGLFAHRSRIA